MIGKTIAHYHILEELCQIDEAGSDLMLVENFE
jgi:hypothetical protein